MRDIGNDLHMDYSTIGQTTHLAARMEQLALPGSIRLTAETLRLDMQVEDLVWPALDPPQRRRRTAVTRCLETLEQIVYADALGFDIAWLAELHFCRPFSILSSPLIPAAALAQRRFAEEVMPAIRGL